MRWKNDRNSNLFWPIEIVSMKMLRIMFGTKHVFYESQLKMWSANETNAHPLNSTILRKLNVQNNLNRMLRLFWFKSTHKPTHNERLEAMIPLAHNVVYRSTVLETNAFSPTRQPCHFLAFAFRIPCRRMHVVRPLRCVLQLASFGSVRFGRCRCCCHAFLLDS